VVDWWAKLSSLFTFLLLDVLWTWLPVCLQWGTEMVFYSFIYSFACLSG
jgi:hypothetical protein